MALKNTFSVYVNDAVLPKLEIALATSGQTKNQFINQALLDYIAGHDSAVLDSDQVTAGA